jgi:hypothetical protein
MKEPTPKTTKYVRKVFKGCRMGHKISLFGDLGVVASYNNVALLSH